MAARSTEWKRVSKRHLCLICGRPDWCLVKDQEKVVLCMRVDSQQEVIPPLCPSQHEGRLVTHVWLRAAPSLSVGPPQPRQLLRYCLPRRSVGVYERLVELTHLDSKRGHNY